ncbi:hypothetical protein SAMN02745181_0684 [Rubritalea squalenifaciens DSM 18772]|uniref:Lipoprotein n=1 Tax=Rubritalea squalenifaciens DSM 18772 TaxID=1123071 RepID=A0A1M6DA06_9BACT|nr:hypothetical protein [Rubritalea squalenifaciens]SHI70083.1 hypothetical protein SAMN02745181_0684 [Rubritalea squalenifaciens DSM 18772]
MKPILYILCLLLGSQMAYGCKDFFEEKIVESIAETVDAQIATLMQVREFTPSQERRSSSYIRLSFKSKDENIFEVVLLGSHEMEKEGFKVNKTYLLCGSWMPSKKFPKSRIFFIDHSEGSMLDFTRLGFSEKEIENLIKKTKQPKK